MKNIPGALWKFISFFILVAIVASLINVSNTVSNAKEYKASVIKEIENSNFNNSVISSCVQQAQDAGYTLTVNKIVTDAADNKQIAEVVLGYDITIPVLKISKTNSTRGVAR